MAIRGPCGRFARRCADAAITLGGQTQTNPDQPTSQEAKDNLYEPVKDSRIVGGQD